MMTPLPALRKHLEALSFLLFASISCFAQSDMVQYISDGSMPFLNRSYKLKVDYKWNLDGNNQLLLNEGMNHLEEGNLSVALANLDQLLLANPKLWIGYYYRGMVYMQMSRFRDAKASFTAAIKLEPNNAVSHFRLAESLELLKDYNTAEKQYQLAARADPNLVQAYYRIGNLHLLAFDILSAGRYYKKCIKADPKFPDAYLAQGIVALIKNRNFNGALESFNEGVKADSAFAPLYYWRGLVWLSQKEKEKGLADWNHFLKYNPVNGFVRTMHGILLTELNKFDDAFADFRKVLSQTGVNEDKFQGAQSPLDKRIDLQFAANYLIKKGYGLNEQGFFNLKAAFCLLLVQREEEAYKYLEKAQRSTSSPALYLLYAIAYEHANMHNEAFYKYSKALELDNDIFDAHKKRSIYYSEMKNWDAANKDLNEMLRIQPGSPTAYKLRGLMEASRKRYPEAIADLSRFIQNDSTDNDVYRNRALSYSLSGKHAEATPDVKRLLYLNSHDDIFYDQLLNDYIAIKDTLNVIAILSKDPPANTSQEHCVEYIRIMVSLKQYDLALTKIDSTAARVKREEKEKPYRVALLYRVRASLSQLKGEVAYERSQYEQAIELLNAAIKENETDREALMCRMKCYLKLKNRKKAEQDLETLKTLKFYQAEPVYRGMVDK